MSIGRAKQVGDWRRRLEEWLRLWRLTRRLDELPEETGVDAADNWAPGTVWDDAAPPPMIYPAARRKRPVAGRALRIGDPARLRAGDIVLLPPETATTRRRPVYVGLVGELEPADEENGAPGVEGASWLVIPFGRLPLPAVPGELVTRRQAASLRVLCVWNCALAAAARLARGWLVGRLTARELDLARRVRDLAPDSVPPAALARRVGPPLIHPLDPRHVYLDEERLLWFETPATGAAQAMLSSGLLTTSDTATPRAAEDQAPLPFTDADTPGSAPGEPDNDKGHDNK